MRIIILTLLVLLITFTSFAAERKWNGAGFTDKGSITSATNTDFNDGANWLPTGALATGDDLIINLNDNSTNTVSLSAALSVNSLTINGNVIKNAGLGGQSFTLNTGIYSFNLVANHTVINSCTPPGNQNDRAFNIIITNSGVGKFTIGGNLSATNTNVSISNPLSANTIKYLINGNMIVNGTTLAKSLNTATSSNVSFFVGNAPAKIKFTGNVVLDDNTAATGNSILLGSTSFASTGAIEFDGNVSLGFRAATDSSFTAATVIFDGTGTQTYTQGDTLSFKLPNVVIGSLNDPTVLLATANAVTPNNLTGNLTINGSSTLDLKALQWNRNSFGGSFVMKSTSILKLSGVVSVANGGTVIPFTGSNFPAGFTTVTFDSTSTVEFNGTSQTIPSPTAATIYGNLTLSNNSSVKTLGGNISINRALKIDAGVTMALGDYTTTLKSNAQTTAFVTPVNGTVTYGTGNFVIERFLKKASSWRLMATPITSGSSPTISASWREGQSIGINTSVGFGTRTTGPTSMDEYTQRASMKHYNMANNTYVDVKTADLAGKIQKDQGYYIFVRGDRTVAVGGTTGTTNLRIAGQLRTGNQTFSVIKNLAPASGFQSIGNPYASRIDVRNVILLSGGVSPSFIIWNPNGGFYGVGQFEAYVKSGLNFTRNGSSSGAILNTIESGQAVFLQNNSTTTDGSLTIKELDKVDGSSLLSRPGVTTPTLEINMFADDNTGNQSLVDGVSFNFGENYTNDIDNNDVRKITNTYDNISIKHKAANLVMERRKTLQATDTLRLNIGGMRLATYKLQIDPSVLGNLSLNAFLVDKFLASETALSLIAVTNVPFSITNDAASRAADRLMIVFKQAASAPLPFGFTSISAEKNTDKNNTVKWNVANEINIISYSIERSTSTTDFTGIGTTIATGNVGNSSSYKFVDAAGLAGVNYYRIKAKSGNGAVVYSNTVKVVNNEGKPQIAIQPNPVLNKILNIHFDNMQGIYDVKLFTKHGAAVFSKRITVSSESEVKNIIAGNVASGLYEILFVDAKGKKVSQNIFIQ